jgi:hypothetical protein
VLLGGDEIGEGAVWTARRLLFLLAQEIEPGEHLFARFVGVDLYRVIFQGVRGEEAAEGGAGREPLLGYDAVEQTLHVGEELSGLRAFLGVVEDPWMAAL